MEDGTANLQPARACLRSWSSPLAQYTHGTSFFTRFW